MINSSTDLSHTLGTVLYTEVLQFNMNFIVIADQGYITPFTLFF